MPRKAKIESVADADAAVGGVAAVDRALSILAAFKSDDVSLTLNDLAQRTQLYKSTVLRLLASLVHAHLIQQLGDGRYTLGVQVARLHSVYAASFSMERVVTPVLRQLVTVTGESAAYHVRQGEARLCLYRVDSPQPIRDHIQAGDLLPFDRGTGARVLTAFDPDREASISPQERPLYAEIRARGYCTAVGDRLAEVAGISAPVFKAGGALAGALTLTMPCNRYQLSHVKIVLEMAKLLSARL